VRSAAPRETAWATSCSHSRSVGASATDTTGVLEPLPPAGSVGRVGGVALLEHAAATSKQSVHLTFTIG